jgi:uncharacterized membrane protein
VELDAWEFRRLATWRASADYALAVMFGMKSSAHFTSMKYDLERMVPRVFPRPMWIIYGTGVLEFLGAAALLVAKVHSLAGTCLMVLLVVMFPANVRAARERTAAREAGHNAVVATSHADVFYWADLVVQPLANLTTSRKQTTETMEYRW